MAVVALAVGAAACGAASGDPELTLDRQAVATTTSSTSSTTSSSTTTTTTTTVPPPVVTTEATTTTGAHPSRTLHDQAWEPFAVTGPVTLHHPADRVEAIGFHQSGHDGAQTLTAVATSARWFVQEDRDRDTAPQGAADVVVEPDREIRSPVTGRVLRGGTYTLYCDNVDQYVVIEPDARPGWEVKVLHVEGLALAAGQRVEAGVTRLAARARVLPFPSSVEDDTAVPAWPHVHIEVVDPAVRDRPTGPGCP